MSTPRLLLCALGAVLFAATSTQAQVRTSGWPAWYGCWHAEGAPVDELLCIEPAGDGVRMITLVNGVKREETRLVADDEWRDVVQDQCRGVERARWSKDRRRLFLNAELTCGRDTRRTSSGVLAFLDDAHWLSVQSVTVDGETATRSTRYQLVRDAGVASRTARMAAATSLGDDDVDEAADYIDDAAVQEWLIASGVAYEDASGSTLDMLNRGGTRTVIVERSVYVRPYAAYAIRACFGAFCGYRYYSPWGYDLYGWRPYRPVVFVNSHYHRYRSRPPVIIRYDHDRDRYRDRDRDRGRADERWRDRDRDRARTNDDARVTRGGYTRDGVRSTQDRTRSATDRTRSAGDRARSAPDRTDRARATTDRARGRPAPPPQPSSGRQARARR